MNPPRNRMARPRSTYSLHYRLEYAAREAQEKGHWTKAARLFDQASWAALFAGETSLLGMLGRARAKCRQRAQRQRLQRRTVA